MKTSPETPRTGSFEGTGRPGWPAGPPGIPALWPNLAFVAYLAALCLTGSFMDWQELLTEPWLIMRGLKSYNDIATQHPPLLTELLALVYRVFGTGIKVRIIMLIIASGLVGVLTYLTAHRLAGRRAAGFSLLLMAVFWPFYGGTNFWFDTFLPVFYLAACLLLINGRSWKSSWLAGLSLGMAFLLKQSAGFVGLAAGLMVLLKRGSFSDRWKRFLALSAGIGLPPLICGVWYFFSGQLASAVYWIFQYNLSGIYAELARAWPPRREILRLLMAAVPVLLVLIKAAFSRLFRKRLTWDYLLVLAVGFSAAFTIFPRWERWHVAPSVPFLVIGLVLSGKFLLARQEPSPRMRPGRLMKPVLAAWLIAVVFDAGLYYPPLLIDRLIPRFAERWPLHSYAAPAWVDEHFARYRRDFRSIAQSIRELTKENDRIFVWGWQGERLYAAAGRLPAGKFYYCLPWYIRLPRFKEDLLTALDRDRPRLVIELRRQYPGVPTLGEFGIDLEKKGFVKMTDLAERFPEVSIWSLPESPRSWIDPESAAVRYDAAGAASGI